MSDPHSGSDRRKLEALLGPELAAPAGDEDWLGTLAVMHGWLTPAQLAEALVEKHGQSSARLGEILIRRGWIASNQLDQLRPEQSPPAFAIPRYRMEGLLGEGSTGIVYKAFDPELDRRVAIKVLKEPLAAGSAARQRFEREARAAASLSHPHVLKIHDLGEADGRLYLVTELVEGGSLADLLRLRRLDVQEAARMVEKVARGVAAAHEKGIVHRDLKPGNILMTEAAEPKVADFGLAHRVEGATKLTKSGLAVGTPLYMAPEQVEGREVTPRTDIYALGAILYEGLTGRPAHEASDPAELFAKILHAKPVGPRTINRDIPPGLEAVCLQAMAKRPECRYGRADELAGDLQRCLEGKPVFAQRGPRVGGGILSRVPVAVAGVILLAGLGIGWRWWGVARSAGRALIHLESGRRVLERMQARLQDPNGTREELRTLAEEAAREFRRVLAEAPDHPEAHLGMGRACVLFGDAPQALGHFARAIEVSPTFAAPYLARARILLDDYVGRGHASSSREDAPELARLLDMVARDVQTAERYTRTPEERLFVSAALALGGQRHEMASDRLAEYLRMAPMDAMARVYRGDALVHLNRHDEAEQEFAKAVEILPRYRQAYERRAGVRHAKGDLRGALTDYTEVLSLEPQRVLALNNRAVVRIQCGDLDGAIADASEAVRLNPAYVEAYCTRGSAKRGKGDLGGALADFNEAIRLDPHSAVAYYNRGIARAAGEDHEGAIADFTVAIRLDASNFKAVVNRGIAHTVRGEVEDAIADFSEALRIKPNDHTAYWNRGNVYYGIKRDFQSAAADLQKALELAPADWPRRAQAQRALGEAKRLAGK